MTAIAGADLFINRELSWLAFNERVLEEAADPGTPLLERARFAAITASNLDEFFMVRVAGLKHLVAEGEPLPDPSGESPQQLLTSVSERTHRLVGALYRLTVGELLPALAANGIRLQSWSAMPESRQAALSAYCRDEVLPVLTPLAIDVARPFPLLSSLSLNLVLRLSPEGTAREPRLAVVQVPAGYPRLIPGGDRDPCAFILLEEIIRAHLPQLFPGQKILETAVIRLARDAELDVDDEGGRTQLEAVERELRRRRRNAVVRLEVEETVSPDLLAVLRRQLAVEEGDIYLVGGPLDLRVLTALAELPGFDGLRDAPVVPASALAGEREEDLFSILDEHDVLLHHPYDAYDPTVALLAQAADDPDVVAIKQTLYRTSAGSPILASLQRAAERHKQVTVLVELTARFDEERNIHWARALEEAGAHVIYGVRGYKTHAKICLILRRTPRGLRRYVHLATGNYNERTARVYTDFVLMTAARDFAEDATAFFSALTGYSDPPRLKKLVMAPTELRARLLRLIAREQRRAAAGQPAEITAKMNSLQDPEIIAAIYAASAAGVRIRLNVRGICALRPGVPGVSNNVEVVSIVDRFLEHSRVFCFHNGGDEQVYLSSADWMTRNLDRRIELMFPVESAVHRARVLQAVRDMFRDNVKARQLLPDGTYAMRRPEGDEPPFRVQQHLQDDAQRRAALARDRAGIAFVPAAASAPHERRVARPRQKP